jgi:hypothetical protein
MRKVLATLFSLVLLAGSLAQAQTPGATLPPTRIILLVDSSTGIQQHFQRVRTALTDFIDGLPAEVEIGLISTGGQMKIRVAPTADHTKVREAAAAFSPDGGSNAFLDALVEADQRFLKNAPDKRGVFVVISTDSETRTEPRIDAYNKFVNDFRQRRGSAHVVMLRTGQMGLASQVFENLAQNTGGTVQVLALSNALPEEMKKIAARVATGK